MVPTIRRLARTLARTAAGVLALAALAGCGGGGASIRGASPLIPASPSAANVAVVAPAFIDADPVAWPGHAPSLYPVHGIDVSRYQGGIDWERARASGVNFAFIKATEGGDRVDPGFAGLWAGARAAGVLRGAYHFFYWCGPADGQARWFLRNVPRERGALPPVLDLEWNPQSPTCATYRPPPEVVRAEAMAFMDIVEQGYGRRPIIYTDPGFWRRNELWRLAGEEVWLRATAAHPTDAYQVTGWTFWQYSATGIVPGVVGEVDLNAFGGSAAEWRAWVAARSL